MPASGWARATWCVAPPPLRRVRPSALECRGPGFGERTRNDRKDLLSPCAIGRGRQAKPAGQHVAGYRGLPGDLGPPSASPPAVVVKLKHAVLRTDVSHTEPRVSEQRHRLGTWYRARIIWCGQRERWQPVPGAPTAVSPGWKSPLLIAWLDVQVRLSPTLVLTPR